MVAGGWLLGGSLLIQACEQADVRWQCNRRGRHRALEQDAVGRKAIDGRGLRGAISVGANSVGARHVESDEQDVRRRRVAATDRRQNREQGGLGEYGDGFHQPPAKPASANPVALNAVDCSTSAALTAGYPEGSHA
jgi:hypothetical protein